MSDKRFFQDHVRETTVFADFNKPLIARTTRWEYMSRYFPLWKDSIRFKAYRAALAIAAVYFAAVGTWAVTVAALAGAAYFHSLIQMRASLLTSPRKVLINH